MSTEISNIASSARIVLDAIRRLLAAGQASIVVAIDGQSGAGKSTLAKYIATELNAALILTDDFYAADIPDSDWDARTPAGRVEDVIDWRRLREVLEPLLAGESTKWRTYDFQAGTRPVGTYRWRAEFVEREPASVIILDGAYSARPELVDLIDLSVVVVTSPNIREARLARREDPAFLSRWQKRWGPAEDYYFAQVRPRSSFDFVVSM